MSCRTTGNLVSAERGDELQLQIEANEGLFEPLLVEPHPDLPDKFRIIDGERRWTNSEYSEARSPEQYRHVPIEVTDRTLTDEERLRVWIYIHRQRKEWDAKEKEMVAYRLVELMGRAGGANILGITVKELDKLVQVFELSEKFTGMRDPAGAITWARELTGLSRKLVTPSVIDAVVSKVRERRITNSKDLRKLRKILPDPVARQHFLSDGGDIDSAMLRLGQTGKKKHGLGSELDTAVEAMKRVPWTTLAELKGDVDLLQKIDDAAALLKTLRKTLTE